MEDAQAATAPESASKLRANKGTVANKSTATNK